MAKLTIFGKEYKYSKKKFFSWSRFFFSLYIIYFGCSLWCDSANVNGDMKWFKKGCGKIFGEGKNYCTDGVFSFASKLLAVNFIVSGILSIPFKKKIHRQGGLIGFVGIFIYMIFVNPILANYDQSIPFAVLLNLDLMENFLMHMTVCGGFLLIMANGFNDEGEEIVVRLSQSSDEGGDNPPRNGRGPSSR
jgi:hypothetical protein